MTSMAGDLCHAAGQPIYEVRELLDGDPVLDLGLRHECADYLDAVEFAFEYRQGNNPAREGRVSALEIVRVDGADPRTVLTYHHRLVETTSRDDLVAFWGFDVTQPWGDRRELGLR
jgi:hypothetical protein